MQKFIITKEQHSQIPFKEPIPLEHSLPETVFASPEEAMSGVKIDEIEKPWVLEFENSIINNR
ncbi:MAG TPA: hypothetical protein VFP87_07170 [Chitinophagaceae bacterium]|nr:hypothetical protein [Chitinophagaceae bacterium]